MRRSKFETYIEVVEAFINHGPIRIAKVTYKANINYILLKQIHKRTRNSNLIEERKINHTSKLFQNLLTTPNFQLQYIKNRNIVQTSLRQLYCP
ncbi:MAG: hypothetical protein ABSD42_07615 [Candidatus Bathyarchaeia archaeon]